MIRRLFGRRDDGLVVRDNLDLGLIIGCAIYIGTCVALIIFASQG